MLYRIASLKSYSAINPVEPTLVVETCSMTTNRRIRVLLRCCRKAVGMAVAYVTSDCPLAGGGGTTRTSMTCLTLRCSRSMNQRGCSLYQFSESPSAYSVPCTLHLSAVSFSLEIKQRAFGIDCAFARIINASENLLI